MSTIKKVSQVQYEYIEDIERLERYQPGGYHPILIGDILKDRYQVVHKLGHGAFSTIWLSRDIQQAAYVAVKVCTGDSSPHEANMLYALSDSPQTNHPGRAMIPTILDQFGLQGPNGYHRCYVSSPAQSSIADATLFRLFQIETARSLVAQLVLAIAYTHTQGYVHGDIHLGNALLRLPSNLDQLSIDRLYEKFDKPVTEPIIRHDREPLPPGVPPLATIPVWLGKPANEISLSEAHLILSDFGEAFSSNQQRLGSQCRAPTPFLPPEAYFEPEKRISFPIDIWTLACAIWSILGSRALFDSTLATHDDISQQQIDILGELPHKWWNKWEARYKYFDERGKPKKDRYVFPGLEDRFEKHIQEPRREDSMGEFDREETAALLVMFRSMLSFRPEERATIETVLGSDWMVNWGLPEFEKSLEV
ncbi:hypothetical protein MaudMau93_007627 [Microsporum audouinii]